MLNLRIVALRLFITFSQRKCACVWLGPYYCVPHLAHYYLFCHTVSPFGEEIIGIREGSCLEEEYRFNHSLRKIYPAQIPSSSNTLVQVKTSYKLARLPIPAAGGLVYAIYHV